MDSVIGFNSLDFDKDGKISPKDVNPCLKHSFDPFLDEKML
jgi:hypothetical protein